MIEGGDGNCTAQDNTRVPDNIEDQYTVDNVQTTGSPISGCTCCYLHIYNILKGWQLPDGF